jgi:Glyoxalase-like domain
MPVNRRHSFRQRVSLLLGAVGSNAPMQIVVDDAPTLQGGGVFVECDRRGFRLRQHKPSERTAVSRSVLEISQGIMTAAVGKRIACTVAALSLLLVALSIHALGTTKPSALLGTGEGVNHVIIAVRSLNGSAYLYRHTLGFTVRTGGTFPNGFANDVVSFENHTYLELATIYDRQKARKSPDSAATMQFLEKHQGAIVLGLDVSSASATAAYLRGRNFEVAGPMGGTVTPAGAKKTPPELWKTVGFSRPAMPGLPIFFIEYNRKAMAELAQEVPQFRASSENRTHANGATALYAAWMDVKSLPTATKVYEKVGFTAGRSLELKEIGARGQEIEAGAGKILLVAAQSANGPAARFEKSREAFRHESGLGESVMGVSIEVKSLAATRALLEARTHRKFATYAGPYGESLLVPEQFTRGVWIEFFQKKQ